MKKQKLCACLLMFSLCAGLAPSQEAEAAKADVKLVKTSVKLTIRKKSGKTTYGTAKIKVKAKKGVKVKKVTYKSKNSKIAKVDKKGKVTAKKIGSTKIRVTVKYKKKKKNLKKTLTCKVTVKKSKGSKAAAPVPTGNAGVTQSPAPTGNAGVAQNPVPTKTPTPEEVQKRWDELIEKGTIKVEDGVITDCDDSFEGELIIPEGVTGIKGWAFAGRKLTGITIPSSVMSIRASAFSNCSSLETIKISDKNTKYDSRDACNAIIMTETNTLVRGCSNTIIPTSVTSIGQVAFSE